MIALTAIFESQTLPGLLNELELSRLRLLQEKMVLLKSNNAACYADLEGDLLKYRYRQITTILRLINKTQTEAEHIVSRLLIRLQDTQKEIGSIELKISNSK